MQKFIARLLLLFVTAALSPPLYAQQISPRLLDSIYDKLVANHADKPDSSRIIRAAIDGMLSTSDPYTYFMNRKEADDFNLILKAKYGGFGFTLGTVEGIVKIVEVYKGYPADRGGIRPGDRILEIGGLSIKDLAINEVFPLLRGEPGSVVTLKLYRADENRIIDKAFTREEIKIPSVPYYGLLPGHIGYIKLVAETVGCSEEVKQALLSIKKDPLLKGLILDLRENRGGAMKEAKTIANFFLAKGKVALTERSWKQDTVRIIFSNDPIDESVPMVVLIDELTASSGEILSGALQDHDRAVFIGRKSFGKGLVQDLFPFSGGELLLITTAYYHTPSGRCIQRKEYGSVKGGTIISDSLKRVFFTSTGRKVFDHDGINPDIFMPGSPEIPIIKALTDPESQNGKMIFRFAQQYVRAHPSIGPAATFRIDDDEYNNFVRFLRRERFTYTTPAEMKFSELQQMMDSAGKKRLLAIRPLIDKEKEDAFIHYNKEIKSLLEGEIAAYYYYNWGRIENNLKDDQEVTRAIQVLLNREEYKRLLNQ